MGPPRVIYAKLVYEFVAVVLLHRCDRETVDYDFSLPTAIVPFSACVLRVIYRVFSIRSIVCARVCVCTMKSIGKFLITYLNNA